MDADLDQKSADELPGYEKLTLPLEADKDGELVGTLVYSKSSTLSSEAPAVLYLHGYVDYFFQTHLADAFEGAGIRFFALDLRRYGRSLRPGNHPCLATTVDDYFEEITAALDVIQRRQRDKLGLMGHSTGGLIACHYAARGQLREKISALILNSPFFRFRANPVEALILNLVAPLGRAFPLLPLPKLIKPIYGRALHKKFDGEWDYDLAKKPLRGFPMTAGWFTLIRRAHRGIRAGLGLPCPILILHSDSSHRSPNPSPRYHQASDIVLDIEDMKTLGVGLGPDVSFCEISGGVHDLSLSSEAARARMLAAATTFAQEKLAD